MADLVTDNLALPKPKATNQLSVDVERLRTALDGIDAAVVGKASAATVTAHTGNTSNPHGTTAEQVGAIPASAGAVTDAYLGSRTVDPTAAPSGNTGTLTALLSGLTNRVRAITGAANWTDAPATTLSATKAHLDSASNPHGTTAAQVGAIAATNGSVTDALVGSRTINQDLATPGSSGTLTQLLSWMAGRIKAITGAANWTDAPATTLAGAATHHGNTNNPHSTTAAQVATASGFGSGAWAISVSGNAATASKLQTARTINGVSFDGTANIEVSMIKSIQRGQSAGTANRTVTISAVNPAKSVVVANCATGGYTDSGSYQATDAQVIDGCYLLNGTTLQIIAGDRNGATLSSATVFWQVVEYV